MQLDAPKQDVRDGATKRRPAGAFARRHARAALLASAIAALAGAPIALAASAAPRHVPAPAHAAGSEAAGGFPIRGAIHNPPHSAYFRTTGIFSNNGSWTNRVENLGSGGAALDTCHAPGGGLACLDGYNLSGGLAFMFQTSGSTGGEILLSNPSGAPFTTNAHGVATGLNANFLQGRQASEFQLANQPAANANALGGQPASAYVTSGQLLFADVVPGPGIRSGRGATAVAKSGEAYIVTFGGSNVSSCSYTASPTGAALSGGQLGVEPASASQSAVVVNPPSGFSGGFDLQVVC
jgi:hypothetical protein